MIVVQHLAPDRKSGLANVLAQTTALAVREASEDMVVEPNCIYVIPAGRDMSIVNGRLHLLPQPQAGQPHGIDAFFRSLAEDNGHLSMGVVLSGCLRDGTLGLASIKAAGGATFAQDESALHTSMTRSAIDSGCVDFVLPPEEIARELARIAQHPYLGASNGPDEDGHGRIIEIVRHAAGVDFTHYKKNTLHRRITRRMMLHKHETPREYEEHLRRSLEEVELLYQDILISVTSFFRDSGAYEAVAREVLSKLLSEHDHRDAVRIWVIGCSSGEEAYSLAMVFAECAAGSGARLQLFATDVNARCIAKARAGFYPRSIAQDVSPDRLQRFFVQEADGYRICKEIREQCIFSRHNLLGDPPFSRVDFISCRNLLIYLEPVLQQRVFPLMHYALKPGGWLWLGNSESVGEARPLFDAIDPRHKIFIRRAGGRLAPLRVQPALADFHRQSTRSHTPYSVELPQEAQRVLVAKYAPPGVVISSTLEIVHFHGDTSPYLAPSAGAASLNLMKMLHGDLCAAVHEAIQRAEKECAPVRTEDLRVTSDNRVGAIALEVIPLSPGAGRERGFAVLFDASGRSASPIFRSPLGEWWQRIMSPAPAAREQISDAGTLRLNQELAATKAALQNAHEQDEAANEELQSANEEAQSANEELQSINEELETSKEETEASNEELLTLNDELISRNEDLSRLHEAVLAARDYAESIIADVRVPVVTLDATLRVKSASRAFYDTFQVAPGETEGRLFYELGNGQWHIPPLRELLEGVLSRQQPIENYELQHRFEKLGLRHVLLNAKRLTQSSIDNPLIILSIEDTTERMVARSQRQEEAKALELIARGAPLKGILELLMHSAERHSDDGMLCSVLLLDAGGKHLRHGAAPSLPAAYNAAIDGLLIGPNVGSCGSAAFERRPIFATDIAHDFRWSAFKELAAEHGLGSCCSQPVFSGQNELLGTVAMYFRHAHEPSGRDCELINHAARLAGIAVERARTETALRESEEFNRSIVQSSSDCIKVLDVKGGLISFESGLKLLGIEDPAPLIGKLWTDFWVDERDRASAVAAVANAAAGREDRFVGYFRTLHGEDKWWNVAISPILDGNGKPERLLAVSRDVTQQRKLEESLVAQATQLAQADRSKDEFLAMLAHELRNPLAPLSNAAEILDTESASDEEREHARLIISRQLANMTRMIDDLLDVSRINEGKIELRRQPVALETILAGATSMARSSISAGRQKLEVTLPSEAVFLHGDATRLEQVFVNLIGNASKYGGEGCHIGLSAERDGNVAHPEVVVRVRDNGTGIDPELLPRIFDLFVQATRSLDRQHGGLGIGLTLVRRLINLHGGSIEARSEGLGNGSEFIVRLPILRDAPRPEPLLAGPITQEPSRRILIVDDNTDSARSLAILQRRRGHEVRIGFTGPEAIEAAAEFRPQVVLLDIGLPGMDGFEVARKLRAMPALAGALLIAMTGYASAEDQAQAKAAGFDEHLVKPIDLALVREWLQSRVSTE